MKDNFDYKADLKERLQELKQIEGFPIAEDEDILTLSNPPFYTACPNPYINDFIEKHGSPYNEETDDYHCEPYVGDVSQGKNNKIYNAHAYHTKVPHDAIEKYIQHYTKEGDVVLDSFSGSGMTGIAATKLKRNIILSDIAPISTFISYGYNYLKLNQKNLEELSNILQEANKLYDSFYVTNHYNEGKLIGKGEINSVIWSDVYNCPFCNEEYIFWDLAEDEGEIKDSYICKKCNATITKKESESSFTAINDINGSRKIIKQVPVKIDYTFQKKKFTKYPDNFDLDIINDLEKKQIDYWVPCNRMPVGDEARRNDKKGILYVQDFFHKRTLLYLAYIYDKVSKSSDKFNLLLFTSVLNNLSKRYRYRTSGGGGPSGNLYIPSLNKEWNVVKIFKDKIRDLKYLESNSNHCIISNQSITDLSNVSSNSVDYIFTDPPFGSNIMYSELSFIWESWLKVITDNKEEAIINKSQSKNEDAYYELLNKGFIEYYRILKPKRWITVEFHNSKSSIWNVIQNSISNAGFIISSVSVLDKKQNTFVQSTSSGSVKSDLVISAYKPSKLFEDRFLKNAGEGLEIDFIHEFLHQQPIRPIMERTEKMLYSKMLSYYIQHGYEVRYDAKAFYQLLRENFAEEDGYWFNANQINSYMEYLKKMKLEGIDEIKQGAMMMFVTDEKSALVWLHNFLNEPKSFSDIHAAFTQLANIQGDEVPELKDLLEQNFIAEGILFRRPKSEPEHNLVIEKREKQLMRQFESLLIQAQTEKKKIKTIRKEAVQLGFEHCYKEKRFQDILTLSGKLNKKILEENAELNEFVEAAEIMVSGLS